MKIGVVFPQTEIGADPDDIARFATRAEALGYDHVIAYDHVLGAGVGSRPDWRGPYTSASQFHEPFVLFSYLAALTQRLELVTAVIILPQRQTVLVAKQAACLDVLSRGRLRLGIGTGWNPVEYEGLGENFHDRGERSEEQIDLMRRLWAEDTITFEGQWHRVTDAGVNPLPPRRRIPVWLGGMAPQVIERVGRIGDGWFPFANADLDAQIRRVHEHARTAGRDPGSIGIECILPASTGADQLQRLKDAGVTQFAAVTMNMKLVGVQAHIDAITRCREVFGSV